jgi:hypothetical protein
MTMPEEPRDPEMETVQKQAGSGSPQKPEFKAAVGLSREWDARKAGREVAEDTLKKLDGKKPDFFLLFATIHYEKYGGFQELLNGVWEVLPEGTPLIGGTVAGFMNNYGCYTRGATAMAVSYPNMDVAVGIGHNTKRAPHRAAKECADMIKKKLEKSTYPNSYLFSLVSGPTVPELPIIGNKKVVKSFPGISFILKFFGVATRVFQFGPGKDEEVFFALGKKLNCFEGIGGASSDNLELKNNFQFFDKGIDTNCVVAIAYKTDIKSKVKYSMSLKPIGKKFVITKSSSEGYVVEKIDGKPAVKAYLNKMGWSENLLDERLYRRVFYYPLVPKNKEYYVKSQMLGLVYGDKFIFPTKPPKMQELEICITSGSEMLKSVDSIAENNKNAFFVICGTRLETLGSRVYDVKEIIDKKITDAYLGIFTAGEYITINGDVSCMYQSDNSMLY